MTLIISNKQEAEIRYITNKFEVSPQYVSRHRLVEILEALLPEQKPKFKLKRPLKKKYFCVNHDCRFCGVQSRTNCKVYKFQKTLLRCDDKLLQEVA